MANPNKHICKLREYNSINIEKKTYIGLIMSQVVNKYVYLISNKYVWNFSNFEK